MNNAKLLVAKRSDFAGGTWLWEGTRGTVCKNRFYRLRENEYLFTPVDKGYRYDNVIVKTGEFVLV